MKDWTTRNAGTRRAPACGTVRALCGILPVLLLIFVLSTPALAFTTTEVDTFGNGSGLSPDTSSVKMTTNGNPATVTYIPGGPFSAGKVAIAGDPGSVTVVFDIAEEVLSGEDTFFYNQSITMVINDVTGQVTASGTDDSGGAYFGASVTLTVDAASSGPIGAGAAFGGLTAIGDLTDHNVQACLNFSSGLRVCTLLFDLDTTPSPPPPADGGAAQDAAQNAAAESNYVKAIQMFAAQMSNIMLFQLPIIGEMLDSKHQLETQRLYGETAAEAYREYAPTEQVCAFGTLARSTAPSKFKVDDNIFQIDNILARRQNLSANTASAYGPSSDAAVRIRKYAEIYCDPNDDDKEIKAADICHSPVSQRRNKDVSYRRTIENQMTLDLNFTDATSTPDEEDVISLAKNLYNTTTLTPISGFSITAYAPAFQYRELQDARMLSAVRSVEHYSYASIAAEKASGTGLNASQLQQVMKNLGVPAADVVGLVGANPSYFAQMDMLTQKMYQDPNFYTNLYTDPVNVERMKVVLQAIRLMADRDKFEESLRREMLISMLLEMRLRQAQAEVDNSTSFAKFDRN